MSVDEEGGSGWAASSSTTDAAAAAGAAAGTGPPVTGLDHQPGPNYIVDMGDDSTQEVPGVGQLPSPRNDLFGDAGRVVG